MPTGIIGQPFVFGVLFVDEQNAAIAADDVQIVVFKFDEDGAKNTLVDTTSMSAVAGDSGRFVYVYEDTSALAAGDVIYGFVSATNPDTDARLISEVEVSMVVSSTVTGASGMTARFLRGG